MASTDLLHIERGDHDGTAILQLEGELDLATAGLVPEAVSRLLRDGHTRIVVDLRAVNLIDSVGVRALLHIRRRMWRSDGTVAFVCAQEPTGRVLRVMGLYDPLECTDDFETALARARG